MLSQNQLSNSIQQKKDVGLCNILLFNRYGHQYLICTYHYLFTARYSLTMFSLSSSPISFSISFYSFLLPSRTQRLPALRIHTYIHSVIEVIVLAVQFLRAVICDVDEEDKDGNYHNKLTQTFKKYIEFQEFQYGSTFTSNTINITKTSISESYTFPLSFITLL